MPVFDEYVQLGRDLWLAGIEWKDLPQFDDFDKDVAVLLGHTDCEELARELVQ